MKVQRKMTSSLMTPLLRLLQQTFSVLRFPTILVVVLSLTACVQNQEPISQRWDSRNTNALLQVADSVGAEGLNPKDYEAAALRNMVSVGDELAIDAAASTTFTLLAMDMVEGRVRHSQKNSWYIKGPSVDPEKLSRIMDQALAEHTVAQTLRAFLPSHSQYRGLKAALMKTPPDDVETIARLRINLERWRWMPRDLGSDYLFVNVPGFDLVLYQDRRAVARHRTIVGKVTTPTPQFETLAEGVVLNPSWYVPPKIAAEGVGSLVRDDPVAALVDGYVSTASGGVRQAPGPNNALGRMKLVMPNRFAVKVHDTPAKKLFDRKERALSHGCIRADKALDLAAALLKAAPGWDRAAIDQAIATLETTEVELIRPIPVFVGYFTIVANDDGTVTSFSDIYGRDQPIIVSLNNRPTADTAIALKSDVETECSVEAPA